MQNYKTLLANFTDARCIDEPEPDYAASIVNDSYTAKTAVNRALTLPADYLPTQFVYYCHHVAQAYNAPIEAVLMSALCIAGAAAGGYVESYFAGYQNRPSLWIMLVASSGRGKSQPLFKLAEPLQAIDSRLIDEYKAKLTFWKTAEQQATKSAPNTIEKPKKTQILCAAKTDAARAEFVCDNPRGGLYLKDELRAYIKSLSGKFSTIGVEQALEIADCKPLKINTKTDDDIKRADFTFLPVIGTIQNSILPAAMTREFIDNGLLARFQPIVYPPTGKNVISPITTGVDKDLQAEWKAIIDSLWALGETQRQFTLSAEGWIAFNEEHAKYCASYKECADDSPHKSEFRVAVWNKMLITIHRLILIAQLLNIAYNNLQAYENTQIDAGAVRWAFSCAPFLIANTMQVYDIICGAPQDLQLTDKQTMRAFMAMLRRKGRNVTQQALCEITGIDKAVMSRHLK